MFPWTDAAREAIADDGVGIEDLLADPDHGAVKRAVERIDHAIENGYAGSPALDAADELCSYPVARVIVSYLTDVEETIVPAFAAAEARTFRDRATHQIDSDRIDVHLADFVAEFDISMVQDADGDQLYVAVEDYLGHAPDASLTDQPVSNGNVPVSRRDTLEILEAACRDRVSENLPHDVPDALGRAVEPVASDLRDRLTREDVPTGFPVVNPTHFPPCLNAALRAAQAGDDLHPMAEHALVSFLTACGMDATTIATLTGGGLSEARVSVKQRHLGDGEDLLFEPPSCETMVANGCCIEPDDVCETIENPHSYYDAVIDDGE